MRGLVDGLGVVLENVALDFKNLCRLYTGLKEVLPDPDKLIDCVLETSNPLTAIAFHVYTNKRHSNTLVKRLLRENFGSKALQYLDDKCDQEVFTKALSHHYARGSICVNEMLEGLLTMKRLGYQREIRVFEAVLGHVTNQKIFREMVEEHPNIAAKPEIYQRLLYSYSDMDFLRFVGMEAKKKGIRLEVKRIFEGRKISGWNKALRMLLDIGAKPSEAFQVTLDAMEERYIQPLLTKAVEAKATVDPTARLLQLGIDKFNETVKGLEAVLVDAMQERLILLDDGKLTGAWKSHETIVKFLFRVATENSCQALPLTLLHHLKSSSSYDHKAEDVRLYLGAFCYLPNPDKETCKLLIDKLKACDMVSEATCVKKLL